MKVGDMITPKWGALHMYETINPIGIFNSTLDEDQLGLVVDFQLSATDVPYVRILVPSGVLGWARYERVRVIWWGIKRR